MKFFATFFFCFFGFLTITFAQDSSAVMKIYYFQSYSSEHTDPDKNRYTFFVSGTQGDSVLNITMITSPKGIVQLKINNVDIPKTEIVDYQELTDFIYDYAKMPKKAVAKEEKNVPKKINKQTLNEIIIEELIKDGIMAKDTKVYDLVIGYDKMFYNGKRQSDAHSKKYKKLYENQSGTKLQPTTYYHVSQTLGE